MNEFGCAVSPGRSYRYLRPADPDVILPFGHGEQFHHRSLTSCSLALVRMPDAHDDITIASNNLFEPDEDCGALGLSYTAFSMALVSPAPRVVLGLDNQIDNASVSIRLAVTNTGSSFDGTETVLAFFRPVHRTNPGGAKISAELDYNHHCMTIIRMTASPQPDIDDNLQAN